jgi:hypothetical protein
LLGASAFAARINKGSLHLEDRVTVAGKQLTPGDYKVEWNGTGQNVDLRIVNGRDTVVSVPARVVPESASTNSSGYATRQDADGSQELTQIFFGGRKYQLDLAGHNGSNSETASGAN